MPTKAPLPAKLTRPVLHDMLPRERLFARLEAERAKRRALCVVGPPGAGKTALVATWLEASNTPSIWLQVDPGDDDLATFFHYLGLAAETYRKRRQVPLPALTPEYLPSITVFSRRFFRELFARLPSGSVLVLDNYQEVPTESVFHALVAEAVEEVPAGMALVVISRRDPPEHYARLIAHQSVGLIDWEELKLTREETRAIAVQRTGLDESAAERLYAQSGGWAAGLTLLIERLRQGHPADSLMHADQLQDVFSYFAGQILAGLSAEHREILLRLSLVPRVAESLAESIGGSPAARKLLDTLYRRRLFTDRRRAPAAHQAEASEFTYQFHALFRAFLGHRAREDLPEAVRLRVLASASEAFEAAGLPEDAFEMARESRATQRMAAVILRHGQLLMEAGRWKTLADWCAALPEQAFDDEPWLRCWRGTALSVTDQNHGLRELDLAEQAFARRGDAVGRVIAAHGAVMSIVATLARVETLSRWARVLEETLPSLDERFEEPARTMIAAVGVLGLLWARSSHPSVPVVIAALTDQLYAGNTDDDAALMIGTIVIHMSWLRADLHEIDRLIAHMKPVLGRPRSNELARIALASQMSLVLAGSGQPERAIAIAEEARLACREHGLANSEGYILGCVALARMALCEFEAAATALDGMQAIVAGSGHANETIYHHWRFLLECARGNVPGALAAAPEAERSMREAPFTYLDIIYPIHAAAVQAAMGDLSAARRNLETAEAEWRRMGAVVFDAEILAIRAFILLREGRRAEAFAALLRMLDKAQHPFHCTHMQLIAPLIVDLFAEALRTGVEVERVRQMVQAFRLRPPTPEPADWPWPVRVHALGGFTVTVSGTPLTFDRKAPRKPLALLMALICEGGRDVPAERLMDALWPDDESDAAAKSFRMALVRLRNLLGASSRVRVVGGLVSLDDAAVRVDALEFAALSSDALGDKPEAAARALALYQGPLLPQAADAPWSVHARERLRGRFLDLVTQEARRLEAVGDWLAAADWYQRGIDADEIAERLYQGRIRCLLRAGCQPEAAGVLERLRRVLAARLRVSPSPDTIALLAS